MGLLGKISWWVSVACSANVEHLQALCALGYGLMIMLDESTSNAAQELILLVAGLGIGCLFQPPLIGASSCAFQSRSDIATALQAAMPLEYLATSTSTLGLLRCAPVSTLSARN